MKKVVMAGMLCLGQWAMLYAQEYKAKLANSGNQRITIQLDPTNLKIEGYNGNELIIQTSAKLEAPPERAKGLRPLYNSAVDNTGLGLSVVTEGNTVRIEKASRKSIPYTIRVPQKSAILYEQTNWTNGDLTIQNVEGDLELRTNNGGINLVDVTGPVVANTINGEIKVVYSSLNQSKPTAMSTVNGAIDITLPASAKANLKLSSIHGEMYTDFDLGTTKKDGMTRMGGGHVINGTTNGGGVDLQLKTINSDIYIRKQK
jgi:hypothetical protein